MILRFGLTKKSMNVTVNNQSIIRKHFCDVKTIPNGFILEKKKSFITFNNTKLQLVETFHKHGENRFNDIFTLNIFLKMTFLN